MSLGRSGSSFPEWGEVGQVFGYRSAGVTLFVELSRAHKKDATAQLFDPLQIMANKENRSTVLAY